MTLPIPKNNVLSAVDKENHPIGLWHEVIDGAPMCGMEAENLHLVSRNNQFIGTKCPECAKRKKHFDELRKRHEVRRQLERTWGLRGGLEDE